MTYSLLIDEPPIQVLPALAGAVGFSEAAVLQMIHYRLNQQVSTDFREGRYWVQNVSEHLCQKFFFWEVEDIEYMLAQLEQSGILMVFSDSPQDSSGVKYYTINYELLKWRDSTSTPVKLVPVIPFIQDILPIQKANTNTWSSFTTEVHEKGHNLYIMTAQDLAHFLACELTLEVQEAETSPGESGQENPTLREVICHFPRIADEQLKKLVWEDPTLYEIIMVMFQIKIMEHLLLFCAAHHTSNLIIFADDVQANELGIYRDFLSYQDQKIPSQGEKTEIIISVGLEALDRWASFSEDVIIKFRQTLWRAQKTNPTIQYYLKSQSLTDF